MPNLITKEELVRIAERWERDKPGRYVEQLIEEGFISPAEPEGRKGHSEGVDWYYQEGSDLALRTVLRLRKLKIRGNALHYSLWYLGVIEHSQIVSDYVASIFRFAPKLALSRLLHVAERSMGKDKSKQNRDLTGVDFLQNELERVFSRPNLRNLIKVTRIIDPTFADLPQQEIEEAIAMFSASSLKLDPDDFDVPIRELHEYVLMDLERSDNLTEEIVREALSDFRSPGGYERFIERLQTASGGLYDLSRVLNQTGHELKRFVREVVKISAKFGTLTSNRFRTRLGPWGQPAIFMRAFVTGIFVWYLDIIRQSIYNSSENEI